MDVVEAGEGGPARQVDHLCRVRAEGVDGGAVADSDDDAVTDGDRLRPAVGGVDVAAVEDGVGRVVARRRRLAGLPRSGERDYFSSRVIQRLPELCGALFGLRLNLSAACG